MNPRVWKNLKFRFPSQFPRKGVEWKIYTIYSFVQQKKRKICIYWSKNLWCPVTKLQGKELCDRFYDIFTVKGAHLLFGLHTRAFFFFSSPTGAIIIYVH